MFTLKKEKKKKMHIDIYSDDCVIYQGRWDDLPLSENIIIEKSIDFFNDPEPCDIHRTAVRLRITEELLIKLIEAEQSEGCQLLMDLCTFEKIDRIILN